MSDPATHHPHGLSGGMTFLMAAACGVLVANLYYAQPLIALIGPDVGLSPSAASLVVTLTQIGYAIGLLFLVPLGDIMSNRRLILTAVIANTLALGLAVVVSNPALFLASALILGLAGSGAQMIIPLAAAMATDATRGRVVGNIMSGLLLGILLSRPLASLVAADFGWRGMFMLAIGMMVVLTLALLRYLPDRRPQSSVSYGALLASLWGILRDHPLLQRRAAYQTAMFGAFTLFWTAVPLELAGPNFNMGQRGIALFAFAGAAGALAAPIAGRVADRGWSRTGTFVSQALVLIGFALSLFGAWGHLIPLVAGGVILDVGVQGNMVISQRAIYGLAPAIRSRVNGIYIAIFFLGGAFGSAVASPVFTAWGWTAICAIGIAMPALSLLFFATEFRRRAA
jgi:predicted MFS family arabinose efflux permease